MISANNTLSLSLLEQFIADAKSLEQMIKVQPLD